MFRIGVFCLLAPFALMEMFLYHRYDVVLLGTLYLVLSVQADFAAGRFLRETLFAREAEIREAAPAETEELHVPPLGATRSKAEAPPQRPRAPRGFQPQPDFKGRAHEVLGVNENAATRTIVNAFRYWVKRFHPDHARDEAPELANARVRRLTDAKELLLQRRRARKAA